MDVPAVAADAPEPAPDPAPGAPLSAPGPPDPGSGRHRPLAARVRRAAATVLVAALSGALVAAVVSHRPQTVVVNRYEGNAPPLAGRGLDIQAILSRVEPAVVTIDVTEPAAPPAGDQPDPARATVTDHGTGTIVSAGGRVLTNHHVITMAGQIRVWVHGLRTPLPASVLYDDADDDLAVLQLSGATQLTPVELGDSSRVRVGDPVLAIGDALDLGGVPTVTTGIISAIGRSVDLPTPGDAWSTTLLDGLLQTDAPLNPGNSGGPLVDSAGHVIGVNTLIGSGTEAGYPAHDIGFAIPSNTLRAFIGTSLARRDGDD